MIDASAIERIMQEAKIEEVVGDFVTLKKKGARYVGLCPFHNDRHATNFVVYPAKQCYKCFACDAKGGVVQFLMKHENLNYPDAIRWLGKKYKIETDMTDFNYTPPPPRPAPPPLKMLELPMSMVTQRERTEHDPLCNWIRSLDIDNSQKVRIEPVLKMYHVGHVTAKSDKPWPPYEQGTDEFTVFWQIDENKKVRTGKMMKYKDDGHRDKNAQYGKDWIHSMLSRERIKRDQYGNAILFADGEPAKQLPYLHIYDETKQEVIHTLFGMHLLNETKGDVNIVESEKTAIIMSILYGHSSGVWMATGGKQNLKREKLLPIIDAKRRIVLYPDRDAIEEWEKLADAIDYQNMTLNTEPVKKWWIEEDGEKADIADVVLRMMDADKRAYKTERLDEIVTRSDAVRLLKERLKLKAK